MFYVYSPWFFLFLAHLFPFLFLLNITSSIQILYLIKLSTAAAPYKIETVTCLRQVTAFCQGLSHHTGSKFSLSNFSHSRRTNDPAFGLPSQGHSLIWLKAFPTWSFLFPSLRWLQDWGSTSVPGWGTPVLGQEMGAKLLTRERDCQYLAPQAVMSFSQQKVSPTFFKRSFNVHREISSILSHFLSSVSSLNTYSPFPISPMLLNIDTYFHIVPPSLH